MDVKALPCPCESGAADVTMVSPSVVFIMATGRATGGGGGGGSIPGVVKN